MTANACHLVMQSPDAGPAFAHGFWHVSVYQLTSKMTRYQQLSKFHLKNFNILNNSVPLYNIFCFRIWHPANNSTKPEIGKGLKKFFFNQVKKYWQNIRKSSLASLLGNFKYMRAAHACVHIHTIIQSASIWSVVWSGHNMLQMDPYSCFSKP